jgi:hypothetical protein
MMVVDFKLLTLAIAAAAISGFAQAQSSRFLVTVDPAGPAKGYEKVSVFKAALGTGTIQVWANTAIDPDCTAQSPGATLSILEPPAHGSASVSDEPFYMAFPPANPRSACNSRKVPGHRAFYTAAAGYAGHDRMVLQGSSPEGHVRRITVDIDVR